MAEREKEQSIQKKKLRYWCYDDGSVAAALFNEENKASVELNIFDNIDKMELSYDLSQHPEWDVGQTEFSCGICGNKYDVFSAASLDSDQLRDGLYQLEQMLDAYAIRDNAQPLWELFSYIMAGYVSRLFDSQTKRHSLYFYRAPIVWLAEHKKDVCGGFEHIERFVDCLAVDTSRDAKLLFYNPAVIPTKRSVDKIIDCAYIVRKNDKAQRRAPTQYRDTSVLIHPFFFENKDLADFIQRNRWATVLVFNKKIDDECTIINKVNLNDIALPEWEWQEEKISNLIEKYTQWLSLIQYQENYKKVWLLWDNMSEEILYRAELAKSVQKGKRIQGSERASKLLQIKALIAFIHFCKENSITDAAGARWLRENWLGKLLGVNKEHSLLLKDVEKKYTAQINEDTKLLDDFKKFIKYILEEKNGRFVKYVTIRDFCGKSDEFDIDNGPWAYAYIKKPKKGGESFKAIKIRKKDLDKLALRTGYLKKGTQYSALKTKIEESQKKSSKNNAYAPEDINFVYKFQTERFKFKHYSDSANKQSVEAIIFRLEEMTFLKREVLEYLLGMFPATE